ncbi:hypothetical protein NDU88_004396, partial [Pleurodeles waltl]
ASTHYLALPLLHTFILKRINLSLDLILGLGFLQTSCLHFSRFADFVCFITVHFTSANQCSRA